MGRTRRTAAQKAASARGLQIARERRLHNQLGLPSDAPTSSHPPLPNHVDRPTSSAPPPMAEHAMKPKVNRKSVPLLSASQRAQKRDELKLARELERIAALERDLQDVLRRETKLREEIKALKLKKCHREMH
uniref:Uncharacterized protein n=1 Tax=Ganoderma boninense TaxID=34458 RepID=A0A5K1JVB9_9APHY|nr:Uncharacterized protein [Ganoderma boninense]